MKKEKLFQFMLIVLFSCFIGACSDKDNDEPKEMNEILTINGLEFNSEINDGGLVEVVDFHAKAHLYPTGVKDDSSYPQVVLEFICPAFDLNKASIGKMVQFSRISCGYFTAANDFTFYFTMIGGKVSVADVNIDQWNNGTITLHFDNVKLPEKDNPSHTITINGNVTLYK